MKKNNKNISSDSYIYIDSIITTNKLHRRHCKGRNNACDEGVQNAELNIGELSANVYRLSNGVRNYLFICHK